MLLSLIGGILKKWIIIWTSHAEFIFLCYVSINHCCFHIPMAQQFLHSSDIIAYLKQVSCKAVPQ